MFTSIVDSHAHLSSKRFDADRAQVVERAFQEGIKAIFCPTEINDTRKLGVTLQLIEDYPHISAAAGVHPHSAQYFSPEYALKIEHLAKEKKIKAVGEIGLDYHYNFSSPSVQKDIFRQQLHLAKKLRLPVIIHSRKAAPDIVKAIQEEEFKGGGILHCFTENWEFAEQMIDLNFFISFSGILTYPQAEPLREVAQKIPLDKLLVETDSPYLVPLPYRGKKKRNEPTLVKEVAKLLAELKNLSWEEIAGVTTRNYESIFFV